MHQAYGKKFEQVLLHIKTDHNEFERRLISKPGTFVPSKHEDFVQRMSRYCEQVLKDEEPDDADVMKTQINQVEKCI